MKRLIGVVAQAYLAIGALLGTILWVSYGWAATWGAPDGASFLERAMAGGVVMGVGFLGLLMRALLWLPSLALWALSDTKESFWFWLAPGFFATSS